MLARSNKGGVPKWPMYRIGACKVGVGRKSLSVKVVYLIGRELFTVNVDTAVVFVQKILNAGFFERHCSAGNYQLVVLYKLLYYLLSLVGSIDKITLHIVLFKGGYYLFRSFFECGFYVFVHIISSFRHFVRYDRCIR